MLPVSCRVCLLILSAGTLWSHAVSAQGPCAEATVAVVDASHAPVPGAVVAFHRVVHRAGASGAADSVLAEPRYVGRTSGRGVYVLRGAGVAAYVVRVRGRSGAAGEAWLRCGSASRSTVRVRLTEPAD